MKINRDSIFLEAAQILSHQSFDGAQHVLRLQAPECASRARPGQFVHLQCDEMLAMRRPLSIMRADANEGWIELLYKVIGTGTEMLANRTPGESLSVLGPIGTPFDIDSEASNALLLGGGVGMPPMIFLAESLVATGQYLPTVLLASEVPFPFHPGHSRIQTPILPAHVTHSMPLLEELGVPCRLASTTGYDGCFDGYITELARIWLQSLNDKELDRLRLFACGPHAMLEATARLADEFNLRCQVSLEEYMACAVGGCAGCVVRVETPSGPAMKRV